MAVFTDNDFDRLDWSILRDGAVSLYMKQNPLNEALEWFISQGYIKYEIECSDWKKFRSQMSSVLNFSKNFGYLEWGGNLDALNDAFRYLNIPQETGVVFCFHQYHCLNDFDPRIAIDILDIFERHSRYNLLYGKRLLALVQSDDPHISFSPIGAGSARWNEKEQLNGNRGI